ncbi:NupC/NupG family nucleoside CNT transporter [Sphingomonas yabuuchiae]|uniref:CNT family concentrative nucleoside transporter n=1 Tax=Sphingomonas yabuuchiae TaxID=172044 RepID=A0AA40ZWZ2_9SPHN|nr:NupC/NupG family nucleoside CNT transporter [Sphingomonas yabuuchiae]MBB4611321.1 CNT family concentrative nucleoside transporter [Sphingomonas yabuuchiae]MBN3557152.1 NupC/NupG family nucleoside CNT transporter [Sphingomonas yabuuchiae]
MNRFAIGIAGILVILGIAVALSTDRRAIRPRVVGAAFALQAGIAILVLYVPWGKRVLQWLSGGVAGLLGYANEGTKFLFGALASDPLGRNFAIQALPVIIFFAALVSILYYLGIMQLVVRWLGGAIEKVIGVSKVESLCAAANVFVGQSESPLVIRPYLAGLTPAQLFTVMTSGMAGVAGTILAAYASMGISIEYLLAASFMAAPGGILMAKIIMPDRIEPPEGELPLEDMSAEDRDVRLAASRRIGPGLGLAALPSEGMAGEPLPEATHDEEKPANIIMAAAQGAQTGVKLAVAVGAMVLAFVALVALANGLLGGLGNLIGIPGLSFQALLGYVFQPIMALLNVPWKEAGIAGGLFGEKIVLNEFVAYIDLGKQAAQLSPRTVAVITFALCGFANFSSIAIQMAVTGSLAPNQRPTIARLGIRALIAGSLANLMSAALAGLLIA